MVIKGVVVHGRTLGRTLGFPTANLVLDPCLSVERGVYSSRVLVGGESYKGVSNVGVKPTVGGSVCALECHIIDFEGDIYGEDIEVELLDKLRNEIHFNSIEELRTQIAKDIATVR